MICKPCRRAASDALLVIAARKGNLEGIMRGHLQCESPDCPCQHKIPRSK